MGLDQYAFAIRPHRQNTDLVPYWNTDAGNTERETLEQQGIKPVSELAYWRKHPNLQGWMEDLFTAKGGEGVFNCVYVRLTPQDIDALEAAVNGEALPTTTGFFFGESQPEDREDDLAFIAKARQAFAGDHEVYYTSWW